MRNIIIIAMLLAAASAAGWFQIQRDGEHTRIDINRAEIREDARRAIDRGREILDRRDAQNSSNAAADQTPDPYNDGSYPNQGGTYPVGYNDYNSPTDPRYSNPPPQSNYPANAPYNGYENGPPANYGSQSNYPTPPSTRPYGQQPVDYPQYGQPPYTPQR